MVEELERRAKAARAQELVLWVFDDNETAFNAYRKLGFHDKGPVKSLTVGRRTVKEHLLGKELFGKRAR